MAKKKLSFIDKMLIKLGLKKKLDYIKEEKERQAKEVDEIIEFTDNIGKRKDG